MLLTIRSSGRRADHWKEGGRTVLMRYDKNDGSAIDVTSEGSNIRSLVLVLYMSSMEVEHCCALESLAMRCNSSWLSRNTIASYNLSF